MWWIILIACVFIYFAVLSYKNINYWKDRRITHIKAWPFFGSMTRSLFQRETMLEEFQRIYHKYPDTKYIGLHQFVNPAIMIRDTELIKQITVKDFDYFMNHKVILTEDNEPLFGKNLLSLKGQKWKDMRSNLSPAFTGSKMRTIYVLITECAEQFVNYFLDETKKDANGVATVEMKDIFTRYANDVIGTAAFGIKCDSLKEKENEFYMVGKKSTTVTFFGFLKMIGYIISPRFMKLSGLTLMDKKVADFFSNLILTTLKMREEQGIVRPDMIHLLMEARKGRLKHEASPEESGFSAVEESSIGKKEDDKLELTDEDIIAQAFLFFFAGYDTGSTLMGFMAYELATHPEIQKTLQDEIDATFNNEKIDYESVLKMKYLDMVVSETLRKWPPGVLTERECEKPYTIETPNDNEPPVVIEKGISVWIPIYCIHHDPKYFPEPERFDPERFSPENKDNIASFTYLPFGSGPRNCIGSRFALLEIKVLFVHLLRKFDLTVVEKTQIPLKISKKYFNLTTEKGIWLGLKPRE